LINDSNHTPGNDSHNVITNPVEGALAFQHIANKEFSEIRKNYRKAQPKKPIDQRVREVLAKEGIHVGGISASSARFKKK
jgi:hypothetical protein